jgi:hypothetical protein
MVFKAGANNFKIEGRYLPSYRFRIWIFTQTIESIAYE